MAIGAGTIWEVRTTGSDSNGGAFDPGVSAPGTDYSQQNSAQIAFTDLVIGSTNTQLTSAGNPFSSLHPGNFINITGGSGFTTGWYEILSVSGSTATMDRAVGTANSTGGTGNLGGAMASLGGVGAVFAAWVAGSVAGGGPSHTIYVKQGTYTMTSTANVSGGRFNLNVNGTATAPNRIYGYNTNRTPTNTDTGPTIQPNAASIICIDNNNGGYAVVYNLIGNANSQTNCTFIRENNNPMVIEACQATGFTTGFNNAFTSDEIINCYAKSCTTGFSLNVSTTTVRNSVADACGGAGSNQGGFVSNGTSGARHIQCIARNCQGIGFLATVPNGEYDQCTADNTSVGVAGTGSGFKVTDRTVVMNCLSTNNAKLGFENDQSSPNYFTRLYNCGGYNNTSGNVGSNFGVNLGFVAGSANPYNNAGGGDYSLNSTAGGGAAFKGAGYIQSYPGISTSSAFDIGAVQHAVVLIVAMIFASGVARADEYLFAQQNQGRAISTSGMPPVPIVKTPLPVIADQVAPLPVPPGFNVSISARPPIPIVPYFNVVTPVSQIAPPQSILEGSGRMAPLEVGLGVITSATPSRGSQIPITVAFTAQGVGGTAPYTYSWNFGDGGTSTQQNPSHTYITFQPSFAVSVTVTDNAGNTVVGNLTVTIVPAPPPLVYAVQVAPSFVPEDGKVAPGPTGFWNGYFPTPFEPPPPAPVMAVQVTPPPDLFPDEGAGFAKFAADRGSGSSIVNLALMARLGFLLSPSNGYFVFLPTDLCCPIDLNGQLLLYMKFINGAPDNVVYWQCAMNAGHYGQLGWDTNTSSPKLITGEWPVGPTNVPPADNVPDQPLSNIPGNFDFNFDVDIPTGISSANNLTPDDIKQANADPQAPPIKKIGGSW